MDNKQIFEQQIEKYMENGGNFEGWEYEDIEEQAMFMTFWIGVEYANSLKEQA